MVKWLGLRARGHRFESGQDFLGSFELIFEVIVGWCPTRSEYSSLSQSFAEGKRHCFEVRGRYFNYPNEQFYNFSMYDSEIFTLGHR